MVSDRPLRRQAIKIFSRVFLGGARAHYHSWLPSLVIVGRGEDSPGAVRYRRDVDIPLLGADALKARAGERVIIVGSGPSVRDSDLSALPAKTALLLNGAINLVGKGIAEPLAVAIEDERFVWRHFGLMREKMISRETICLLSPGVMRAICEIDAGFLKDRPIILIDDIRKPYGAPRRKGAALSGFDFVVLKGEAGFSSEPDRGVFQGGSVAISALQFALATGAGEIGFIGVDISNANAPRFYEAAGDMAYSGIAGAERRILAHIALARDVGEARRVALVNHSAVSALRTIGLDYRPLAQTVS